MSFFDKLGKTVTNTAHSVVEKTKSSTETIRLNGLINDEEKNINAAYLNMGRKYAELHTADAEPEFQEFLSAIAASQEKIAEYREQIRKTKHLLICQGCGAEIPETVLYCTKCGAENPVGKQLAEERAAREAAERAQREAEAAARQAAAQAPQAPAGAECCPNCGKPRMAGAMFCTFCGNPFVAAAPTPAPAPAPAPAPEVQTKHFTLKSDVLFNFNKATLKPEGQAALDQLYSQLSNLDPKDGSVVVLGYTDRIGSDAYNQGLSERRAQSVVDYLISKGIPADKISARGMGESNPVTGNTCDNVKQRAALIDCLAPDRRVEIEVKGIKDVVTQPQA